MFLQAPARKMAEFIDRRQKALLHRLILDRKRIQTSPRSFTHLGLLNQDRTCFQPKQSPLCVPLTTGHTANTAGLRFSRIFGKTTSIHSKNSSTLFLLSAQGFVHQREIVIFAHISGQRSREAVLAPHQ